MLWEAEDDEWIVLGFEVVSGRVADIRPGSPDLPVVVDLLNRLAGLELPEIALEWHDTRLDRFATNEAEARLFRGDALLHADINHTNLLVAARTAGNGPARSWAVDWGWPVRGAGFVDPAVLVVQLVAAGHSPEAAEAWAARCVAFARADPAALDAYAAAKTRMWWTLARQRPDRTARRALAGAAEAWARHRGLTVI